MKEDNSLLCVILDCNPYSWAQHESEISLIFDQLCIFLNAFLALNHENQLVLIGSSNKKRYIHPNP
jgi:transcription initiation factor TFIIH subunit 3